MAIVERSRLWRERLSAPAWYPLSLRAVLTNIALNGMLVPLNSTMIAVALPDVMNTFGVDVRTAGWLPPTRSRWLPFNWLPVNLAISLGGGGLCLAV